MTRFQRLAAATVVLTFALVTIGVYVRVTGSGLGCPDWPFCYGELLPPAGDAKAWIEWTHRTVAAVIGLLVLGLAIVSFRDHRDRRSITWPSVGAVLLVGFQAWLGRETVLQGNSGESVTAHLAAAMAVVGLVVYLYVRATYPARIPGRAGDQRFTLFAAFAAATAYAVLMFGSTVTALGAALAFPDWPLMDGGLFPSLAGDVPAAHALHRWVAAAGFAVVLTLVIAGRRLPGVDAGRRRLAWLVAGGYGLQVFVGGLQVLTGLAGWTQVAHVALGTLVWGGLVALAVSSYYRTRIAVGAAAPSEDPTADRPMSAADTFRAYVSLLKLRVVELLLVTTVPAMVLASREMPGLELGEWFRLTFWTMLAGTLAAGAANAINQVLDRDIDERMTRTRRRALPTNAVAPAEALAFGIGLGALSVALMALFVNLVAAFLTLLAIAFYIVVYTMALKRTTPQNIVIGGAAGALPPVIGWAAVTGDVGLPAIMLFLIVFYWTPPHFWALSLRLRKDYAAAGVPMLPVVRGIAETSRQIGLYTVLLVAITLVFAVVAGMGLVYLAAAVVLGGMFLWRSFALWRQGTAPEASTAQAIRLYRFSIGYLTLLFAAVAADALIVLPYG